MVVSIIRHNARCNHPEDFRRDWVLSTTSLAAQSYGGPKRSNAYLVICDKVISAHPLYLRGAKHPANIVDDLDVSRSSLRRTSSVQYGGRAIKRLTFFNWSSFVACIRCSSCKVPSGILCDLHHSSILVILYCICMAREIRVSDRPICLRALSLTSLPRTEVAAH